MLLTAIVAVLVVIASSGSGSDGRSSLDDLKERFQACVSGEGEGEAAAEPEGENEAEERSGPCGLSHHPESFVELSAINDAVGARVNADSPDDYSAAVRLRQRLEASRPVPGTKGRWKPVGKGPLHADDPTYPDTYGNGFGELAGRISDYAFDRKHKVVYASVASGGVWRSRDMGRHWRSIGEKLPTQTVGSIAFSNAGGGTLIAVTGDGAFGGNTYGGLGVYRSTNDGRRWKRSRGVPTGALGFKAAVDPTNPREIYTATGAGLFRSKDAGKSFRNVKLPTGKRCKGTSFRKKNCFFANVVTDVSVQAKDDFGHKGGTVLAAVGWRAGGRENFNGVPEAPGNGLYRSGSGRPGTFKGLDEDSIGFAPQENVGRVELGAATGSDQDHGYLYAVVQDAVLFDTGKLGGLDTPDGDIGAGVDPTATPTYLNGVYVSPDFGKSWTKMIDSNQILLPTSGSTLAQLTPLGFGPGIQSWYNEWIAPDPTRQNGNGVPTRLAFGLEEIYANTLPTAQNGPSTFTAIGPYNANGGPCLLVVATPVCSQLQSQTPDNFTTHPDQHAGMFVPDGDGGVTLFAGNDGGNYTQHTGSSGNLTRQGFGKGANRGFHTLLPYGVAASRDGTVYAGLQDNGEIKITKKGRQSEVYGGDGVFTQVDPKNSDIVYEEVPEAGVSVSTNGGVDWTSIDPFVDNPSFYAPLAMDPKDPEHLLSGGKQIVETTVGPETTSPETAEETDWRTVFDLGQSKRHVDNQVSAFAVRGSKVYAGYCGGCDPVSSQKKFFTGLATNVGGKRKPRKGTSRGWHKAKAKGLPQRFVSSVTIDPKRAKTVYVTLGASSLRPYAPPNAGGKSGESARGGHVYKSTDGGRHFRDISGNLRKVPALWSAVRHGQLIVATTNGVYASRGKRGGRYALLGRKLPRAPVFSLATVPGKPRQMLAASLGRGVYRYTFPRRH